jgi:hypothetical protein
MANIAIKCAISLPTSLVYKAIILKYKTLYAFILSFEGLCKEILGLALIYGRVLFFFTV